uniref:Putative ribonuclease H-like domain-containing protein n=1 Tax=Tanacetum cinerariifolium TaxID=118510 RepID=A0A699SDA1_TANCI|nr:putative ribonuclease H-like domain-containing protein [Tanacetum cinerariifolium]
MEEEKRMLKIQEMKIISRTANVASTKDNTVDENIVYECADDLDMPNLEEIVYSDDDEEVEPKKVIQAFTDPSWMEAMHDALLQFKLQQVWTLVDLLNGKRDIGTKWIYINKKDERGIMVRNKTRLVT